MKTILTTATAAHRRIRGWIGTLDDFAISKHGQAARKIINSVDQEVNWTNPLVYDADVETHYVELTAAELAALTVDDIITWAFISATTRCITEECLISTASLSSIAAAVADIQGSVSQGVPHYYYPTTCVRVVGTDQGGTVASLVAHDEVMFSTGEVVGQGLEVVATIATSILTDKALVEVPGNYNGSAAHSMGGYVWNFTLSQWEQQITMLNRSTAFDYEFGITSDHQDPITGEMRFRFLHSVAGTYNAGHWLHLDMLRVTKTEATATNALAASVAEILEKVNPLTYTGSNVNAVLIGSGIHNVTVQFYRTATTTPIPDVMFDVLDATETFRYNNGQLKSDSNGQYVFGRDNGTYKIRAMLSGFSFTIGTVVVNNDNVTVIMYGDAAAADAPVPVGAMRVYDFFFMPDGLTPMITAPTAKAKIINLPYDYNGRLHSGQILDVTYNAGTGKGYWDFAPGSTVEFDFRSFRDRTITKTLPLTDPDNEIRLEDIV